MLILIDDGTRMTPTARILPHVIDELHAAGVADERDRVPPGARHAPADEAGGAARRSSAPLYGRYKVHEHHYLDAVEPARFRHAPATARRVTANKLVTQFDFVLGVGSIVPHRVKGLSAAARRSCSRASPGKEMMERNQWEASHAHVGDGHGHAGKPDAAADGRGGADGGAEVHRQRRLRRRERTHRRLLLRGRRRGAPRGMQVLARGVRGAPADARRHRADRLALGRPGLLAIRQGPLRRHDGGEGRRVADPASARIPRAWRRTTRTCWRSATGRTPRSCEMVQQGKVDDLVGVAILARRLPDRRQDRLHHGLAGREAGRGEEDRLPLCARRARRRCGWHWRSRGRTPRSR